MARMKSSAIRRPRPVLIMPRADAERGDHHPDERLGVASERLAGRERAGQRRGGHAEQRHRAERQRLEHQAENRADEDRQQPPTLR